MAAQISHIIAGEEALATGRGASRNAPLSAMPPPSSGSAARARTSSTTTGERCPRAFITAPSPIAADFGSLVAGAAAALPAAEREADERRRAPTSWAWPPTRRWTAPPIPSSYISPAGPFPPIPGTRAVPGLPPLPRAPPRHRPPRAEELGISPREYGLSSRLGLDRPVGRRGCRRRFGCPLGRGPSRGLPARHRRRPLPGGQDRQCSRGCPQFLRDHRTPGPPLPAIRAERRSPSGSSGSAPRKGGD